MSTVHRLGAKISAEDKDMVMSWAKDRKKPLDIYKAQIKEDEYGIELENFISID